MANFLNIARPYALAAFEFARDKNQLPVWKAFLETAAFVAKEKEVVALLADPKISTAKLLDLFSAVLATLSDNERKNFLSLLAQNNRLMALPEISELFNAYCTVFEKASSVRVVTAVEVQDDFKQKLMQALSKRTQHQVTLNCEVDPTLIGGAVIHIGDRVIDGSVRGKLTRLLESMTD